MKKKVAIQGIAGSYHDIAARNYHEGEEIEIIPCNTFRDVITTIKKDPAILGMMAIENTIAGSLLQNHELIRESGLSVTGEYKLRISHSLVALPGTSIHEVTEVNSHPIALMQCTDFLDTLPNAKVVEKEDTAGRRMRCFEEPIKTNPLSYSLFPTPPAAFPKSSPFSLFTT